MESCEKEKRNVHNIQSIGNSWIICRSQTHSGRVYYFNTLTGKAVWNLSDAEMMKAQLHTMSIQGQPGTDIENCPEPTEPPVDTPNCTHPPPRGSSIYNKQIINNKFSKPYMVASPFVNPPCHCSSLNHMSDVSMNVVPTPLYNPNMWTVPPSHPVFLAPAINPLTNQPMFNNLSLHQSPQNPGLSNYYQVMNEFPNNGPYHQGQNRPCQNVNARMNQSFSRHFNNKSTHDLRNILRARRKVAIDDNGDESCLETYNDHSNCQDAASITEDDLYLSDVDDEWIEAYTGEEKSKLSISISSVWWLSNGKENTDCWFVVVSAMVLLNHMKFLSSLINSDEKLRVLSPLEVRRRLRSATGARTPRVGLRARRAGRWAAQQANKIPAGLDTCQDSSLVHCCMELVQRNYFVIHLTDDGDLQKSQNDFHKINELANVPILTVNELKEYLATNASPAPGSRGDTTVTVFTDNNTNEESVPNDKTPTPPKEMTKDDSNIDNTDSIVDHYFSRTEEIEKETQPKQKRTVNAGVQTDFVLEPTFSSTSINSIVEAIEIDHTFNTEIVLQSDSIKEESSSVAKKIKLNREQPAKKDESVKKPCYKWRRRRVAAPANTSLNDNELKHSISSTPSFSALLIQQNDNAVDYGKNITTESAPLNDKETSSDVISNSMDSDSMFKLSRKAILTDPNYYEPDIVMFEVTGDQMDYLSKGCDEWFPRFVQIMEEALTQILQQEPSFVHSTYPPPWNIQEATECIKQKFNHNSKVTNACFKLSDILHNISYGRGKIYSDLNSASFMQMYSYGVNLIQALQSELQGSEDIQIALDSLSKLLYDIRNPNTEVSHNLFKDTFNYDDPIQTSNITEAVPKDVGYNTVSAVESKKKESPQKKIPQVLSNQSSPRKYILRSIEKKKSQLARTKNTDNKSSFFTGLGLKKKTPKIIRKFHKCIKFEERLKKTDEEEKLKNTHQFDCEEQVFTLDNNYSGDELYVQLDHGISNDTENSSPKSGDVDASTILKWFVARTACPIHRVLTQIHKFCKDTSEDLEHKDNIEHTKYKTVLFEKTAKLNTQLSALCEHLNSILHRKDTKVKFRDMMRLSGIVDFVMDDSQLADYRAIIQKYLEQAGILLECVNLIAENQTH